MTDVNSAIAIAIANVYNSSIKYSGINIICMHFNFLLYIAKYTQVSISYDRMQKSTYQVNCK
jgi:hypothetical protein